MTRASQMTTPHDPRRRTMMTVLASLPLSSCAANAGSESEWRQRGSRTLVAYFSRSGNTRVVAGLVHREQGTDLFEIRPASPYPEDYLDTVEQAREERDRIDEPRQDQPHTVLLVRRAIEIWFQRRVQRRGNGRGRGSRVPGAAESDHPVEQVGTARTGDMTAGSSHRAGRRVFVWLPASSCQLPASSDRGELEAGSWRLAARAQGLSTRAMTKPS